MADCPCVLSEDETDHSCDEDSDVEPDEDESDGGGWFQSAADWLSNTKETIVAKSRAAVFSGIQGLLEQYAESSLFEKQASPYAVDRLAGGPRGKDEVLIVGGGPGGVLMAMKLKKLGHPVTILEKSSSVGGKAYSVFYRNVIHEMGACYLSPSYKRVVELLSEYDLDEQYVVSRRTTWSEKCPTQGTPFREWFYKTAKEANGEPDVSDGHIGLETIAQCFRYIYHHRRLLKNYNETGFLPRRPENADVERELMMTIDEFLNEHDLRCLKPIFKLAYTVQGYGHIEEESILYGLLWVTPTLITNLLEQLKVRKVLKKKRLRRKPLLRGPQEAITTLKNGFRTLFTTIVDREDIPVINNVQITGIERRDDGVSVSYYRKYESSSGLMVQEPPVIKRGDFLVMAAPPPQALHLLDLHEDEKRLFADVHESTFITTLVDYEPAKQLANSAVDNYMENVSVERPFSVWATRDSHHVLRENNVFPDLMHPHIGSCVSYQYTSQSVNDTKGLTEAEMSMKVKEEEAKAFVELNRHMDVFGKKVVRTEQHRFRYFPRHNCDQMKNGVLWDILEMQGKYRTWYTGSTVCFEAINAILGYNDQLIDIWRKQLDDEVFDAARKGGEASVDTRAKDHAVEVIEEKM